MDLLHKNKGQPTAVQINIIIINTVYTLKKQTNKNEWERSQPFHRTNKYIYRNKHLVRPSVRNKQNNKPLVVVYRWRLRISNLSNSFFLLGHLAWRALPCSVVNVSPMITQSLLMMQVDGDSRWEISAKLLGRRPLYAYRASAFSFDKASNRWLKR